MKLIKSLFIVIGIFLIVVACDHQRKMSYSAKSATWESRGLASDRAYSIVEGQNTYRIPSSSNDVNIILNVLARKLGYVKVGADGAEYVDWKKMKKLKWNDPKVVEALAST